eukprot:TRINITY_DN11485_c0_g1_i1.p1 TRINITY_DN11485_c0_g1~~TRINITY_DN11485_c0_g1_i1.p1  ORF type:complete len:358 (+),score=97.21 TRINITY_DN11485_c0_g1_i1:49-1074(+)
MATSATAANGSETTSDWKSMNAKYLDDFDTGIQLHSPTLYSVDEVYTAAVAEGWDDLEARKEEILKQYHELGCIVVRNAYTPEQINRTIDALNDIIDGKNESFKQACEHTKKHMADNGDGGCVNSIIQFESAAKSRYNESSVEERRDYLRKLHGFLKHDERFKEMALHPRLLAFISSVLNISSPDSPEVFQDMILAKPPGIGREKPWHQDNAYFNLPPEADVVGTWTAIDQATAENGCMHILPGLHKLSHSNKKLIPHAQDRDWQICDTEVERMRREGSVKCAAVCLNPGDMMIFDGLIPHGTPANQSTARRRAIQFHYTQPRVPRVPLQTRLANYQGAAC